MTALLVIFSLLSSALSVLSVYDHESVMMGLGQSAFCNISATINCAAVINSRFSTLLGFPLGSYGVVFSLLALGLAVVGRSRPIALSVLFVLSAVASAASVALFAISHFEIGAVCPVCISMYVCNFALLLLSWKATGSAGLALVAGIRAILYWPKDLVSTDKSALSQARCRFHCMIRDSNHRVHITWVLETLLGIIHHRVHRASQREDV